MTEKKYREPNQRFYDALIIREWYRFGSAIDLKRICIAEFGCYPDQLPLHRIEDCYGGIRAWVATCMPKLSQKLLATPKEKSIEVLDWLGKTKVRCEINKREKKYYAQSRNACIKAEKNALQVSMSYNLEKLLNVMNQPNTVKSNSLRRSR
jgi:hypothetical protein